MHQYSCRTGELATSDLVPGSPCRPDRLAGTPSRRSLHGIAAAIAVALVVSSCSGSAETSPAPTLPAPSPDTSVPPLGTEVDSRYFASLDASILVTATGYPLYVFGGDLRGGATCGAPCTTEWSPLELSTHSKPQAGSGVNPLLLGSVPHGVGSWIATYNDDPLYVYITDVRLGSGSTVAAGEGLYHGGYWYVMRADGAPIVRQVRPQE